MSNTLSRVVWVAFATCGIFAVGCQMPHAPGRLLPNFAAAMQDRKIAAHAAESGFPTPEDVGLGDDESSP